MTIVIRAECDEEDEPAGIVEALMSLGLYDIDVEVER